MNELSRAQLMVRLPRRDWRFWAAVGAAALMIGFTIAFVTIVGDKGESDSRAARLQAILDQQGDVNECRSRAAVWADTVGAEKGVIFDLALGALARSEDIEPFTIANGVAGKNYLTALALRDIAVAECSADPDYVIDPTALEPIPAYPGSAP